MLVFIGLGLYDEKDITLKGLEEIKSCDVIFAEFYTSRLVGTTLWKLEKIVGKKITEVAREDIEQGDKILTLAKKKKVGLLVCGDPMSATTHIALKLQAHKLKIQTKIIHNASVVTAVPSILGLQQYKFGRIASLPFRDDTYFPESPYYIIKKNYKEGLHTLVLLDIQVVNDKIKCMTANEGMVMLRDIENVKKGNVFLDDTLVCVVGRVCSENPTVCVGTVKDLINRDFGPPLHCIVIPGKLHFMEQEILKIYSNSNENRE